MEDLRSDYEALIALANVCEDGLHDYEDYDTEEQETDTTEEADDCISDARHWLGKADIDIHAAEGGLKIPLKAAQENLVSAREALEGAADLLGLDISQHTVLYSTQD